MDKKLAQGIAIGFMIIYFLLPVDVIPDIPIIGQFDEVTLGLLLAWATGMLERKTNDYSIVEQN